jgi:hypothetical protein
MEEEEGVGSDTSCRCGWELRVRSVEAGSSASGRRIQGTTVSAEFAKPKKPLGFRGNRSYCCGSVEKKTGKPVFYRV